MIRITAVLNEYELQVDRRARVLCETHPAGPQRRNMGMMETEPGIFELDTAGAVPGVYRFRVVAAGKTLRGRPFSREQTLTGAVWRRGYRPPPSGGGGRGDEECWGDLINCLLQQKGAIDAIRRRGIDIDA